MKRIACILTVSLLVLCLCGCFSTFGQGDATVAKLASKEDFSTSVTVTYHGKTVTVNPPAYTGFPVNAVLSHGEDFISSAGRIPFRVATVGGSQYFTVDHEGKDIADLEGELPSPQGNRAASTGYDTVGYLYNGLALVTKDGKVGLIDESGAEVLTPTIPMDTLAYEGTEDTYAPLYMAEDAFALPLGGEWAVVTITRE